MRLTCLSLVLLLAPSVVQAQAIVTRSPSYVQQSDLAGVQAQIAAEASARAAAVAAQSAIDQAAAQSATSTVQALIPLPCGTVLPQDTLVGSLGSSVPCAVRPDASRPTVVQAAIVTTDSTGAWSVTWAKAFASVTPYINPQAINVAGSQPYICNVATSTTTTATGKCWQTLTTTLPSVALSLLGLVVNPTGAAASIQVRVAARDTTQ